ncbi:MAG: TIM barrel protein [Pseudomonadota bacterium]
MIRLAPNFHHQFTELPIRERFAAAAALGFDAVEWHFPYELPKRELKSLLDANGQRFIYAVTPSDWASGNYGLAGQPGRGDEFRRSADKGLEYAFELNSYSMQVAPGTIPAGAERAACIDVLARNLEYLCDQTRGSELTLCLEGVCDARFPGKSFVLRTIADAAGVVREVNRPNLKVVFDTYHLRMQEQGALSDLLDAYFPLIGHMQVGNAPVRSEPGVGEIDLDFLLRRLQAKGYAHWVGLEYDPSRDTWSSLGWARRYGYAVEDRSTACL